MFGSKELLYIAMLVFVVGIVLFVKPEIVGLATLESPSSIPLDATISQSGTLRVSLADIPTGVSLTGSIFGDGSAKVYMVTAEGRSLVMDTNLMDIKQENNARKFNDACIDSCTISGAGKDITLDIELDNAILKLDRLSYSVRTGGNSPPKWVGSDSMTVARNIPTSLDMSQLFTDRDGDSLGYIATEAPGVSVSVSGNTATFTGAIPGEYEITIIASDGYAATRAPFRIDVQ